MQEGLGPDDIGNWSVFETEIRRRLWYSIAVLDAQTAMDRGSRALLSADDLGPPPAVINDDQMFPTMKAIELPTGFTDMSFANLVQEATICQKKISRDSPASTDPREDWLWKLEAIKELEKSMKSQYSNFNNPSQPLQMLTRVVSEDIVLTMHLVLRRPFHRSKNHSPFTTHEDTVNILELATEVLEHALQKSTYSMFAPWSWFVWVKWYALAIVLAELCADRKAEERELVERAYSVARESFASYAKLVADEESGMLWRPIAKLMRRVQRKRDSQLQKMTPDPSVPSTTRSNTCTSSKSSGVGDIPIQGVPFSTGNAFQFGIPDRVSSTTSTSLPNSMDFNWSSLDQVSNMDFAVDESMVMGNQQLPVGGQTADPCWCNWDLFLQDMNDPFGAV